MSSARTTHPQTPRPTGIRHLIVVLGDQLNRDSAAFADADPQQDMIWMCEAAEESTQVWSSKPRIAVFIAAMRQFAAARTAEGWRVRYHKLQAKKTSLVESLSEDLVHFTVERIVMVEPGEWRLRQAFLEIANRVGYTVDLREDGHFLCSHAEFSRHAAGRKQLRMEFFYREMRRRYDILMESDGTPVGGQWNYDPENRESLGREGPQAKGLTPPASFVPDALTREAIADVAARFADHPGLLDKFDWPVTPAQAELALEDFVARRAALFGTYQDAMWQGEPWLWHSRLSVAMNLKLLDPRKVIDRVQQAFRDGDMPLPAAEGFIRQILGWREYVRGIYWHFMPEYLQKNALEADGKLPAFYWSGETDMACLRDAIGQTLELGYAHHIQRLMVTGLFALMLGVNPRAVHAWYLAVYVDAVEWVELPNTLGMSQYADGGIMASKPYIATGRYIERMGNHCTQCRYQPRQSTGEKACPFTTLYWDFLLRHAARLARNPRMQLQLRNLAGLAAAEREAIQMQASRLRARLGV